MVLGAAERGGSIRVEADKRNDREILRSFVERHIADEAEALYTDEWPAYRGVAGKNTRHETVAALASCWGRLRLHNLSPQRKSRVFSV